MFGRVVATVLHEGIPRSLVKTGARWLAPGPNAIGGSRGYATKLLLPALSPTMTEGSISKWLVKEGEKFTAGDVLYEMETDKATMEVEAADDGVLAKILVPAGSGPQAISTAVAMVAEEGEDISNLDVSKEAPVPTAATKAVQSDPDPPAATPPRAANTTAQPLLPSVKQLLEQHGVNVAEVTATGPKGHVLKGDVLAYLASAKEQPQAAQQSPTQHSTAGATATASSPTPLPIAPTAPVSVLPSGPYVDIELTNIRKIIAKRLTESKQTVPHSYAAVEVCVDSIAKMRKDLKKAGLKVSVNDFIIRAAAKALKEVPEVNSQLTASGIEANKTVDVSVAVATPSGLITPIVPDADRLSVTDISSMVKALGARAKGNKLKPHEYQGGSFTVSNLGMFGISEFSAVINPPQAAIMALGTARDVPVLLDDGEEGRVGFLAHITAKVSYDERVIRAEDMGRFLAAFKGYMEAPISMM